MPADGLTLRDIELYDPQARAYSGRLRAKCPLHRGDHQRSLSVNLESHYYQCFQCGAKGFLRDADRPNYSGFRRSTPPLVPSPRRPRGPVQDRSLWKLRLAARMQRLQSAFRGSPAAAYCESRGISAELAQRYGAGYTPTWKGAHHPRIVFPLFNPVGLVNVCARSIEPNCPKHFRYLFLRGDKGLFNFGALDEYDDVYIVEGPFDLLAVAAAGYPNTVALCGASDFRPEWFIRQRILRPCLDSDEAGKKQLQAIARVGALMGKQVLHLPTDALPGKDLSAVWEETRTLSLA